MKEEEKELILATFKQVDTDGSGSVQIDGFESFFRAEFSDTDMAGP